MEKVELMTVEGVFSVPGFGLVLDPSFELAPECNWVTIKEIVTVKTPEGIELSIEAMLSLAHYNIKDATVSVGSRWPVVVSLHGINKESVPVGSVVYVSESTKRAVEGKNT